MTQAHLNESTIFENPFTSKTALKNIALWSGGSFAQGTVIIPFHEFYIFSENQKSEKQCLWIPSDNNFEWNHVLETLKREELFVWTSGSLSLKDSYHFCPGIDFIVSWDEGCNLPSLPILFPILKKMESEIEKMFTETIDKSGVDIHYEFENLSSYAFKRVLKPSIIRRK